MDKEVNNIDDARSKYSTYGNGKSIIEILNIGFEPLLTDDEFQIFKGIGEIRKRIYLAYKSIRILKNLLLWNDDKSYIIWANRNILELEDKIKIYEIQEKCSKKFFKHRLRLHIPLTRELHDSRNFSNRDQFRNIAIFESDLTRTFSCQDLQHCNDIISIVTYYTEIFESIMNNGFNYKEKHYIFFTAGAGQTRCKKSTFVSEDKFNENFNRLFCGLTKEEINKQGGMNTNKYLAYTSLCQSNSEIWKEFNIDRAIVVDDIEFEIPNQTVRNIYTESPEDKKKLSELNSSIRDLSAEIKILKDKKRNLPKGSRRTKEEISYEKKMKSDKKLLLHEIEVLKSKYHRTVIKPMPVTIPFTDGFGIALRKMQSSMIRLPFIKGLVAYCPKRTFMNWCSENNYALHKIKDIYGKFHSINDVDYILTRSQFKMWKYFNNVLDNDGNIIKTGWEVYKENFKKYNCDACRCNVERKVKLNAKSNYQILQTLTTEMTDEDIIKLAEYDINNLNQIGRNVQSMLNVLNANEKKNNNMNWLQKSLILYPEMLKDYYVKTLLKNTKDSMIKKMRSGKFNLNGAYTFAIPDTLACLQWWFTDMDKSTIAQFGFVKKDHISCNLFNTKEEIDCLRSPHLDHTHCIRINQNDESTKNWVRSNGIYIGMDDVMSKLLMFDNDGDKLLVHNNQIIIKCAKSFQDKYGMIPNYYDMPKANPELLTNSSLFNGIVTAYHHGNIGTPSNEITKIWMTLSPTSTREEIENAIDVISLRCADVNFTIDFAKTLYKPTIPDDIVKKYKSFSGKKVPHFFIYAKGKNKSQVEELGKCNIDRISDIVKCNKIVFKNLLGKYSYKTLMKDPNVDMKSSKVEQIISLYRELENANLRKLSHIDISNLNTYEKMKTMLQIEYDSNKQRDMFISMIDETKEYVTDVLIKSLQDDINKDTLWRLFGEVIYNNIKNNISDTKLCHKCKNRFKTTNNRSKYCNKCSKELNRINALKRYYA